MKKSTKNNEKRSKYFNLREKHYLYICTKQIKCITEIFLIEKLLIKNNSGFPRNNIYFMPAIYVDNDVAIIK